MTRIEINRLKFHPQNVSSTDDRSKHSSIKIINLGFKDIEIDSGLKFSYFSAGSWKLEIEKCMICLGELNDEPTENIAQCPFCHRNFHSIHWLEWIKKKGKCPVCRNQIK